ncbi:hypothetical protein OsI_21473 [Oryza sativa Indica Group]|uniref:Uncharacterized protein n=2 Tax=Oryza sativa TaxID=4530 RepID=B9FRB1_ORYSJ|nr:hypothetical protein OsI_21473 [Oryza sativa Indica Group]EEE65022.1 hypothetical protein OsJ_19981 [Oryza sativa Japonica Group]
MSRKEVVVAAAGGGAGAESGAEGSSSAGSSGGGGELAEALARRRLYREVTLALRTGLRDAKADFSFLRARGLRSLLGFLRSTASATDDSQLLLFRHSQSIPDLQVIPVLFQNSLHQPKEDPVVTLDHIFGVEPMKITSPPTDNEIALALRVLEGCCLLYSRCTALAHKYKAVKVILNILANRGPAEQGVCLDALISLMLDSPPNQMDFEEFSGLEKVAELLKDVQVEEHIRHIEMWGVPTIANWACLCERKLSHTRTNENFVRRAVRITDMGSKSVWLHSRRGAEADGLANTSKESC